MRLKKRDTDIIKLAEKEGNDADLMLLDRINEIIDIAEQKINEARQEVNQVVSEIKQAVDNIEPPKGDTGDDGYTPVKGKDYYTKEEIVKTKEEIKKLATPVKGIDYKDGRDMIYVGKKAPKNPQKGDLWYKEG